MRNPGIYAAAVMLCALSGGAPAQTAPYAPPLSPRAKLNFDLNWKFVREDVAGAESPPGATASRFCETFSFWLRLPA